MDNYAFITDGTFDERYDAATKTHYWDFKCILNGERVTKTIKSKFDNTVKKLDLYTVQELVVDAEGYVVRIKDLDDDDTTPSDDEVYNNDDSSAYKSTDLEDYEVYDITVMSGLTGAVQTAVNIAPAVAGVAGFDDYCIDLALQNNTLHYKRNAEDVGLHVVSGAKAVVRQYVNNDWTWVEYGSVAQTFNVLTDADGITTNNATNLKQFNGRIVAVLNSRGEAEWVFFWDYTRANTISNGYTISFTGDTAKVSAPTSSITGIAKGERVTFTVTPKDGCTVRTVQVVGGSVLTAVNGVYTIERVNGDLTVDLAVDGTPVTPANISFTWSQPANSVIFGTANCPNGTASTSVNAGYLNFSIDWGNVAAAARIVKLDGTALTAVATQGNIYQYSAVFTAADHTMVIGITTRSLTIPNTWTATWPAGASGAWPGSNNGLGTAETSDGTTPIAVPVGASVTIGIASADQDDDCYRQIKGMAAGSVMQASSSNNLTITMPDNDVSINTDKFYKIIAADPFIDTTTNTPVLGTGATVTGEITSYGTGAVLDDGDHYAKSDATVTVSITFTADEDSPVDIVTSALTCGIDSTDLNGATSATFASDTDIVDVSSHEQKAGTTTDSITFGSVTGEDITLKYIIKGGK